MKAASSRNATAGKAAAQNIQRQAICSFHTGSSLTSSQLTTCAAKMPMTMVSWLSDTSLPRTDVGATSAIYMGESPEAMPMAMPPRKRTTRNPWKWSKAPVP